MTRDEAIKVLTERHTGVGYYWAVPWIDSFTALGILKLDEPKSIHQRLDEAVRDNLFSENRYSGAVYVPPNYILGVLDKAGLKIVEK